MHLRHVLSVLLLTTAAASGAPPFYAMDTCFKDRYPASDPDLAARLDFLREQGFAGYAWTEEAPAKVAEVLALGQARGLAMHAIYLSGTVHSNGVAFSPQAWALLPVLKDSGAVVWLHLTSKVFPSSSAAGDAVAAPDLRRFAEAAASNGLRVAIYPHRHDWTERFSDALRVAAAVDRPNFGVTFNLCHALMCGDEAEIPRLLGEAGPRLFAVTINGADAGAAGTSWSRLIQPLDAGTYDVGIVLRRLRELGYAGAIGLQGYGVKGPYRENLARSMAAWRTLHAVELSFQRGLVAWREPLGGWRVVGEVALAGADGRQLAGADGVGVGLNGVAGKEPDLLSAQEFGDVELHVEFLLGKKSNSGVYLMGRYEVQIYDSFGVVQDAYPGIECGGIYPRWVKGANVDGVAPRTNAARAPGEWQTFDIIFRAPRFDAAGAKVADARFERVVHNGVVVQEQVVLAGPTRGGFAGEVARGPLRLQGDHGPVAFRNVRLQEIAPVSTVAP